jgi:MoxR-like ATPase
MNTSISTSQAEALNTVLRQLKSAFVGKDEIIDLMGIALVARENLFLLGPPGTAKSAMVRALSARLGGHTFEYLLTRFTEPNELFGPFDIRKLREGELVTNTEGMLPEANLVFLDELLNANSAILNSLLMILNERIFRRGRETRPLPVLMIVGASNHLPEDEALQALYDRFLLRVPCDNVATDQLQSVLRAGWQLEQPEPEAIAHISLEKVQALQQKIYGVDLSDIQEAYLDLIVKLRNAGIRLSDRRAVKIQRLIAASAVLCDRSRALISDLWVMRYIWDTEEQIEIARSIVNNTVEMDSSQAIDQHPRASAQALPNPDAIQREVVQMEADWDKEELSLSAKASLKDQLRHLSNRSQWIADDTAKDYVQSKIDQLWQKILRSSS